MWANLFLLKPRMRNEYVTGDALSSLSSEIYKDAPRSNDQTNDRIDVITRDSKPILDATLAVRTNRHKHLLTHTCTNVLNQRRRNSEPMSSQLHCSMLRTCTSHRLLRWFTITVLVGRYLPFNPGV